MSPAMAARWALVCALIASLAGPAVAAPERRPVAVVNLDLADASPARQLADALDLVLHEHPDLSQLVSSTDSAALKDRIDDPDGAGLRTATALLQRAQAQLDQYNNGQAISSAEDGQTALLGVSPSAAQKLFADLLFVEGRAQLANNDAAGALTSFTLCVQLDPARTLDPALYFPEVVEAFGKAKAARPAPGSIQVSAKGRAWVDGVEVGAAPGGFSVPAGAHVVWLTGPDRNVGGTKTAVVAGKQSMVVFEDDPITPRTKVQRARIALARAADATAKAAAMNNLAQLVGAGDAVLLQVSADKVVVQTWRAGNVDHPGFSALREYKNEKAIELLTPLAPPKHEEDVEPPPIPVRPVPVVKWYRKPRYQLGIVAGVAAVIVGGYFLSKVGADWVSWDDNITTFDTGTGPAAHK